MSPRCPCADVCRRRTEVTGAGAAAYDVWPSSERGVALGHEGQEERLGRQVGQPGPGTVRLPRDHHAASRRQALDRGPGHVARGDPHELGQRLGRLLVGHARRLGKAGLDRPRAQRGDGDARAAQLGAQRAPVGQHEGLRGAVAGLSGQRLEGGGRRGVQHRAAMPGDHAGHEQGAQVDDRFDVGAHQRELGGAVGLVHVAHRREARVVDEDVGVQSARLELGREHATRVGIGEVGRNDLGADGVRLRQLVGQCLQAVRAPGHQGQAMAASAPTPVRSPPRCPTMHR